MSTNAIDHFLTWLRLHCEAGERLLLDDLASSPRQYFFMDNSWEYARDFYRRIDRFDAWRLKLISGLRRRLEESEHLVVEAEKRFSTARLLNLRIRMVQDPNIVVPVDLGERDKHLDAVGWVDLRNLFAKGREDPDWRIVRQNVLDDIRTFAKMVTDQRDELRVATASSAIDSTRQAPPWPMPAARLVDLAKMAERLANEVPQLEGRDRTPETEPWELGVYGLWMACYGPDQKSPMDPSLKNALAPDEVQPVHENLFQVMWNAVTHHNREWKRAASRLHAVAAYFWAAAARLELTAPSSTPARLVALATNGRSLPLVTGRFENLTKLGEGVDGDVWRAHDTKLKRAVAVKFVRAMGHAGEGALEHAWALARVAHPNIVTVHDVVQMPDPVTGGPLPAVVMELVEGPTLVEKLASELSLDEAKRIGAALVDAIGEYHARGLAHLDLHGENVIVGGSFVKVLDPLYFETALMGSTASRQAQQAHDVRRVRDLLVRLAWVAPAVPDEVQRFERETAQANLEALRTAFFGALALGPA